MKFTLWSKIDFQRCYINVAKAKAIRTGSLGFCIVTAFITCECYKYVGYILYNNINILDVDLLNGTDSCQPNNPISFFHKV